LVRENSSGKVWLLGGFLYKNIIHSLYGEIPPYEFDFDFVVEAKRGALLPAPDWTIVRNTYGHESYEGSRHKIGIIDLRVAIRASGHKPRNIHEFIAETPFNVQSIAYNVVSRDLIGRRGKLAIRHKVLAVNFRPQAEYYAQLKHRPLHDIAAEKAAALRFKFVL